MIIVLKKKLTMSSIPPNTITTTMSNPLNLPHNLQIICIDEIPDDSVFDDSGLIQVSGHIDCHPEILRQVSRANGINTPALDR